MYYFVILSNRVFDEVKKYSECIDQQTKEKENFFACMSHEIRNPVQALTNSLDLLRPTIDQNPVNARLADISRACCELVLNLVNNILDISKIQAQKMELSVASSDPREAVLRVLRIMQNKADGKGLGLEFHDCDILPTVLEFDAAKLSQVVLNLVSNAIKFTEKGKISVSVLWEFDQLPAKQVDEDLMESIPNEESKIDVTWKKYSGFLEKKQEMINSQPQIAPRRRFSGFPEKGKLAISISDTGIGIKSENIGKLFHLYSQAEASISSHYGGTGLGLWISQSIIHMMGGKIEVHSVFRQGTTFTISLPARVGSEAPLTLSPNELGSCFEPLKGKRCLALDDAEDNIFLLEKFLSDHEMSVVSFTRGHLALEFLEKESVDCIVTDLRMPEMSGQTFICKVREEEKKRNLRPTPIIVVSAESNPEDKLQCLSVYGANSYLVKPIKLSQLLISMYNCITNQKSRKKEILVVDDDKLATVCMERIISAQGHSVYKAHTIQDAIEITKEKYQLIDLIFLDNQLSDGNGKEFLQFLRSQPRMKEMEKKVISISGSSPAAMKQWYSNFEIQAFFQKPLSRSRLITLINMSQ